MPRDRRQASFNVERAAFVLASAWVLAMSLRYVHAPAIRRWGPATTDIAAGTAPAIDLTTVPVPGAAPATIPGISPFCDPEEPASPPDSHPDEPEDVKGLKGLKGQMEQSTKSEGHVREDLPRTGYAYVGSLEVERRGRWYVFEDTSTSRYHSVRKDRVVSELGLRVTGKRDGSPVVYRSLP